MRAIIVSIILTVGCANTAEADVQDSVCILSAAPQVPHIMGGTITSTRVTPGETSTQRYIEFDLKAAGVEATVRYICEWDKTGRTMTFSRGVVK